MVLWAVATNEIVLPENSALIGAAVLGFLAIVGAADKVYSLWGKIRGNATTPTHDPTAGDYITRDELRREMDDLRKLIETREGQTSQQIKDLQQTFMAEMRSIHRSLGRLEGTPKA